MFEGKRILWVAGGRNYDNYPTARLALTARDFDVLITGAATGADRLAENIWRQDVQLPYVGVPAQWKALGKRAGYLRNQFIADQQPDLLLAFPGGKGTFNAVNEARHRGIEVEYAEKETE